jgi:hypothetical protein
LTLRNQTDGGSSWLSYICGGEKQTAGVAGVVGGLKGIGVKGEALDALTDAVESHSALVAVAVVEGYLFYQYKCP